MNLIADTFAKRFDHWKITLPDEDLRDRRSGFTHTQKRMDYILEMMYKIQN